MKGMKLYVLDLGKLGTDPNHTVPGIISPSVSNPTVTVSMDTIPCVAYLLYHPTEGYILFDCGCNPKLWPDIFKDIAPYYDEGKTMEQQLALLGLKPSDINTAVLSHMHTDHTGYLYLFTEAKIYVHRRELETAMASVFEMLADHSFYSRADLNIPVKQYTLIDDDTEICEDVKILYCPGHTPGNCAVQLTMENGTIILGFDTTHCSINFGPPIRMPAPDLYVDPIAYVKSIERLHQIADETNALVIFGHDKEQGKTFKYIPDYYD